MTEVVREPSLGGPVGVKSYRLPGCIHGAKLRNVREVQCPEAEGARRLSPFDALTLAQGGPGVETP
jgi:hypothetical protein